MKPTRIPVSDIPTMVQAPDIAGELVRLKAMAIAALESMGHADTGVAIEKAKASLEAGQFTQEAVLYALVANISEMRDLLKAGRLTPEQAVYEGLMLGYRFNSLNTMGIFPFVTAGMKVSEGGKKGADRFREKHPRPTKQLVEHTIKEVTRKNPDLGKTKVKERAAMALNISKTILYEILKD